jgi:hypothetical protein
MTHEGAFGPQPFETVTRGEFAVTGIRDLKEAAYLQYKLMLLKPVLRASVSFVGKSAVVDYLGSAAAEKEIIKALKPAKAELKSKGEVSYDELVKSGYHG